MKSTLRTQVAAIFTCLSIATGITNAQVTTPPNASVNSGSTHILPPIVSADKLNSNYHAERTGSGILAPKAEVEQGIVRPAPSVTPASNGLLTPIIASSVEEQTGSVKQVTTVGNDQAGYTVRQAGTPLLPPIVQGGGNPNGTMVPVKPKYMTASAPFTASAPQGSGTRGTIQAPLGSGTRGGLQSPQGSATRDFAQPQDFAAPLPLESAPFPINGQGPIFPSEVGSDCNTCATGSSIGQPVFQPPSSAAPVIGCQSCEQGSVSNCSNCAGGGCSDPNEVDKRFAACGFISRARNYSVFDVLYFNRVGGEASTMNANPADDFGGGLGARVTIGRRQDAASGREFTYMGTYGIDDQGTVSDPLGRIQPRFLTGGTFLSPASISGFTNVTTLTEETETHFQSFEYNRVRWGWDVVKVIFGARYILLEDEYLSTTQNLVGQTGSFELDATNHLIGPQIGGELFYDVGYRWSLSGFGKIAYMLNAFDTDFQVNNDGFGVISEGDSDATGAFLLDLGITGHYQLSTRSRFRLGYNLIYFDGVSTSEETAPLTLSPLVDIDGGDDDAFFHGLSIGLEFYR